MKRILIVSSLAEQDLQRAVEWSQRHHPAGSERFFSEVGAALEMLRETPLRWPLWHGADIRRCVLPRLPYSVYYRVDESSVFIEAVLHHRQDATARLPEDIP